MPFNMAICIEATGEHCIDGDAEEWLSDVRALLTLSPASFAAPEVATSLTLYVRDYQAETDDAIVLLPSEKAAWPV